MYEIQFRPRYSDVFYQTKDFRVENVDEEEFKMKFKLPLSPVF